MMKTNIWKSVSTLLFVITYRAMCLAYGNEMDPIFIYFHHPSAYQGHTGQKTCTFKYFTLGGVSQY